jgi:radical SAM superfamily enzyme YgiQ (UPF0313 family)
MAARACKVLIISPQFNSISFWSYKKACEVAGVKYPTAPLGLITVAALLPKTWEIRFVDRNVQPLSPADLDWADLVMTGGMLTQQQDILTLIEAAHAHGKLIAVGGADVTSSPHVYAAADFRVLGEAEIIIDKFIAAWEAGAREGLFEAEKFQADVTKTPIPRYDLLNFRNYFYVGVQFSRGCPFNCEFCDIIELFGRVPRAKTNEQVLAELDRIYELGHRGHVDFVDDNLIGNKKALRRLLPDLIAWQKAHKFPFNFSTEASVNLADDEPLLRQLHEANFFLIYIGIESPDTDTLIATQKKQNIKRSLIEAIQKINGAGILALAGFIVGFDTEKGSVAPGIIDYIEAAPLPIPMISLLYALPNTQLTRRLTREGRLHVGNETVPDASILCTAGLNFDTKRPRREILHDFKTVFAKVYSEKAFFARVRRMIPLLRHTSSHTHMGIRELRQGLRVAWHMTMNSKMRRNFWSIAYECVRRNPAALNQIVTAMLLYVHIGPFSRYVVDRVEKQIAAIDAGEWRPPPVIDAGPTERELVPAGDYVEAARRLA